MVVSARDVGDGTSVDRSFATELKHEYRTVLGADHIGRSLEERFRYALAFVDRQWNPGPVDEEVTEFRETIAPMREAAGL